MWPWENFAPYTSIKRITLGKEFTLPFIFFYEKEEKECKSFIIVSLASVLNCGRGATTKLNSVAKGTETGEDNAATAI